MWGEILQYAMIAINVVPLVVSLAIFLVLGVRDRFRRQPSSALPGISPTREEIGSGATSGPNCFDKEAAPD